MISFNIENFKAIVKARGLKHTWIAKQARLSRTFLEFIIMGKRQPSKESLKAIAVAMGVKQKELVK